MSPDSTKTSSLLFGIQWDLVCKYLEGKEGLTTGMINSDSTSWGIYYNYQSPGLDSHKRMNIYDFAGNRWEWTLEKGELKNGHYWVARGSDYNFTRNEGMISAASRMNPWTVNSYSALRATLY